MTNLSTAYHEASHCVAALELGCPITYVSIRPHEDSAGRARFATDSEAFRDLDDLTCAIIKIAGEVGARMSAGATQGQFNWFSDDEDAEHARHFIASMEGDELGNRHWAVVRAYALLRTRWHVVEALAAKLAKETTLVGATVLDIVARAKREEQIERDRLHGFEPIDRGLAFLKLSSRGRTAVVGRAGRTFGGLTAQNVRSVRSAHGADTFTVVGYASVYNQLSHDLGGFRERISPGAFDAVLATDPDVHFVWDHDTRYVLARSKNNTLRLSSDAVGLRVNADVGPYSYAQDLRVALERGDIDQASFSFNVAEDGDEWAVDGKDNVRRTIGNIGALYDVTVTAKGAYPQTKLEVS
jgi:uncharacterized protein